MNTISKSYSAATTLLKRRCFSGKSTRLSIEDRPQSIDDALAIQHEMIRQSQDEVVAWKCLLPPEDDQVVLAPIFSNTVQQGPICRLIADDNKALIEPEIAFVLAKDLPARKTAYSNIEIDTAIASTHMALELMQFRFTEDSGCSFYEKLADGLVNQGLFIGPEIEKEKAYQASTIAIEIGEGEDLQCFAGKHPNDLPQLPIYWFINYMSQRGTSFKAGDAIITGSYAGIVKVNLDQIIQIKYQDLGQYQVEFKEVNES